MASLFEATPGRYRVQVNNATIALAGESGDGIISLGEILTKVLAKMGLHVLTFRTYPAEVRGGQCIFTINAQHETTLCQGDDYDILLCTDATAYNLNKGRLKGSGIVIYNSESHTHDDMPMISYGVPLRTLTKSIEATGSKNILMLGVLADLVNLDMEIIGNLLEEKWGKRLEIIERNRLALKSGWDWAASNLIKKDEFKFQVIKAIERLLVSGNEALCLGAMAAGCKFFAGYPITPATDMLEWLMNRLPKMGGVAMQIEDEISALGAVLGASFSGVRAMTATSGPGFALMTELVNLAGAAEIPIVIVDVQRAGPSTGMPTKTEQSDLYHAAFGGPGESPRIVIAPTDVTDCFYQIMKAFNLADKYQLPVILLSDQSLSHRHEAILTPNPKLVPIVRPKRPSSDELEKYYRYLRTEDGVSSMSIPGMMGGQYVATGIERDEIGLPSYQPENHELNMRKRMKKLERAAEEDAELEHFGAADAKIGVISWGSTAGAVKEAVQYAISKGINVTSLHPKMLFPVPKKQIGTWASKIITILVVEVNQFGQYHHMLQAELGRDMHSFRKTTGLPFTPREIFKRIEEVSKHGG